MSQDSHNQGEEFIGGLDKLDRINRIHQDRPRAGFYNPKLGCLLFILVFGVGGILLAIM